MNNKTKIYLLSMCAILLMTMFAGCSSSQTQTSSDTTNLKKDQIATSSIINQDKIAHLSIGSGCIGCGRCVMIDPEHFSHTQGVKITQVISQDNLNSSSLEQAIESCPVQVIAVN